MPFLSFTSGFKQLSSKPSLTILKAPRPQLSYKNLHKSFAFHTYIASSVLVFPTPRKMYRSSSTPRVSDEFLVNLLPPGKGSPSMKGSPSLKTLDADDLPVYHELISDAAKKEIPLPNKPSSEKAIHIIPLVLILCALILWLLAKPIPETVIGSTSKTN